MSDPGDFRELARTFLLTRDMSATYEHKDMLNRENWPAEIEPPVRVRCVCLSTLESDDMFQCLSCKNWLHQRCVNIRNVSNAVCPFCQYRLARAVKAFFNRQIFDVYGLVRQVGANPGQLEKAQAVLADMMDVLALVPKFVPTQGTEEEESEDYVSQSSSD